MGTRPEDLPSVNHRRKQYGNLWIALLGVGQHFLNECVLVIGMDKTISQNPIYDLSPNASRMSLTK